MAAGLNGRFGAANWLCRLAGRREQGGIRGRFILGFCYVERRFRLPLLQRLFCLLILTYS
ncbi:hypothetical protein GCWU000324_02060 [Kingella oralis ATCC 51147]|uniref:Uncharacterized protein n=1 Tax=Kingella oralis ATCC 51147 TaxID=629741 RepID=C4GJ38_9NEIS|nr:hypothetical protein GCWU000324_02060 [Kingella oralis ATCC 51147]